jgi:hypothetical protein
MESIILIFQGRVRSSSLASSGLIDSQQRQFGGVAHRWFLGGFERAHWSFTCVFALVKLSV